MILDITPVSDIDWDSPGKRIYHVPFTFDGVWGRVRIPLCVICGSRPGKTLTIIGGTHGDEYEGPVAAKKLIESLNDHEISGRMIIIPVLNAPAFFAAQRESPLDGGNMNRAFPGNPKGSITSRIAHFVTTEVLTRSDIVVDFHSAGAPTEIIRCMSFHEIKNPEVLRQHIDTAFAFGTPFTMIYTSEMGTGLLTEEAEKMGKITIGSELGYGASTEVDGVMWAYRGTFNVMKLHGLLPGEQEHLLPTEYDKQRLVSNTNIDTYITAPVSGISEPLVKIGQFVRKGDPVMCIHNFEEVDVAGVIIRADKDGYVMARRFRAETKQGDLVIVIATEVDVENT
jgi:predicted deacylase